MMIRAREAVERVAEYKPQPEGRAGLLRLDLNENTVGCPPGLLRAIRRVMTPGWCAVYPEYQETQAALARYYGVSTDEMILTNGVDDSIMLICDTFVDPDDVLVIPYPTFSIYQFFHEVSGGKTHRVPYNRTGCLSMDRMIAAGRGARWMALANPNNPTGTLAAVEDLRRLLKALPGTVVLVDEAYFDFAGTTILPWIRRYPNLIVARTLSKAFGLAALRIGLMFAHRKLAGLMRRIHAAYAVNALAAAAAAEALRFTAPVARYAAMINRNRERFCRALNRLSIPYLPSSANFVLIHAGPRANEIVMRLRRQGILVRGWPGDRELKECIRITIGSSAQMRRMTSALPSLLPIIDAEAGAARGTFIEWFA